MPKNNRGFLLLECLIALVCVGIALSLLLTLHVKALQHQKTLNTHSMVLIHAASARHIQPFHTASTIQDWHENLEIFVPEPRTHISWEPAGRMKICWHGGECWALQ
jgi:Tfp pilus assembly protein PilV